MVMDCFVVPSSKRTSFGVRNDGYCIMSSLKDLICSECLLDEIHNCREDDTWIEKFDLYLTWMDIHIDEMRSDIDRKYRQRIFPMMDLSTVSVHDRFL